MVLLNHSDTLTLSIKQIHWIEAVSVEPTTLLTVSILVRYSILYNVRTVLLFFYAVSASGSLLFYYSGVNQTKGTRSISPDWSI